jgi:tetratricopeptide (TPR) repeat protein
MLSTTLVRGLAAAALSLVLATGASAAEPVFSKDAGPANAGCDANVKGSAGWRACVGTARAAMSDDELFYAGYWLAKNGRYTEALTYLNLSRTRDARVLTYIGFATRKQGDVNKALPLYAQALAKDPNFVVARAYLGEAYLTKNEPALAKAELTEIAARCGTTCAAYVDLERHIAAFLTAKG